MGTPGKGRNDHLELGDYNAVCYECGRKFKASQLRRHWQGYYVCPEHWEARQPQDFVRGVQDIQTPPWTQPMPTDSFVQITCYIGNMQAISGYGISGCMIAGYLPSVS